MSDTEQYMIQVSSVLQRHQVTQHLQAAGVEFDEADLDRWGTNARFTVTATPEQWVGVKAWVESVGASTQDTTLADTGSFFVYVPKEQR